MERFLLATFCALFTATLQAADVTITVNGRVVAKPCTIQTKEANVNLGDLYTRNLQQPGSASGWHNITLSLTDCPVETSAVTAIVTGSTDNIAQANKSSHFIFRVPPLTVADKCLLTQHLMQQKHREWVSL